MLVESRYEELERLTRSRRLSAREIEDAITEYGCELVLPPEGTNKALDVFRVVDSVPEELDVRVDLWCADEGRSDLTLELRLRDTSKNFYDVQIDNIHVL